MADWSADGRWVLRLRRASARDAGVYEARAFNSQGSCGKAWTLRVRAPKKGDEEEDEDKVLKSKEKEKRLSRVGINSIRFPSPPPFFLNRRFGW